MKECGMNTAECKSHLTAINETLRLLNGKWKMAIIGSLHFGKKRFMELQREIEGIGPKMLSKELQELEQNGLIKRNMTSARPVSIDYEMTDYGKTLQPVIREMAEWGARHQKLSAKNR